MTGLGAGLMQGRWGQSRSQVHWAMALPWHVPPKPVSSGQDNGPGWTRATRTLLSRPSWLCKEQRRIQWATGPVLLLVLWPPYVQIHCFWGLIEARSCYLRLCSEYFDDSLFVLMVIYSHSVVVDDDEPHHVFNPISPTRHLTHQRCSNAYRTGDSIMFLTVNREANC